MKYKPCKREYLSCEEMQVVVLMGGLGTRLKEQTLQCPKPLIPLNGKPFFEYELQLLLFSGFRKFVFLVGYRAKMIEEYFGNGIRYGKDVSITYSYDGSELLGTGGAIIKALPLLEDDFMLIYADSFMDVDYFEIIYRYFVHKTMGKKALMTIMENCNRFDKSNVVYDNGEIKVYDKKNKVGGMSYIDYGIEVFCKEIFYHLSEGKMIDLSDVQKDLVYKGQCAACEVTHRFYEIGTPESLDEFKLYLDRRLGSPHKACFIDRDGVINEIVFNEETELLDSPLSPEQFQFLPDAIEGLKMLSDMGIEIFIVTNQPAAAKGKTTLSQIYDINTFMSKQLQMAGVNVVFVCVCPHHPLGSIRTQEKFLVQRCSCRKPMPGMLINIMKKHWIDTDHSYMIGDSYVDMLAGQSAGIKTAFVGDFKCDVCRKLKYIKPDVIGKNLLDVVSNILKAENLEI